MNRFPTQLDNYFGRSFMVGDVELFPITIFDWMEFEALARKYLLYGESFIECKLQKNTEDVGVFDVLMSLIAKDVLDNQSIECNSVFEVERMLSIITKQEVKFTLAKDKENWHFKTDSFTIDRNNYPIIRKVILNQNIVHEPLLVKNEKTQAIIDRSIKVMRGKSEFDFHSMLIYVSNKKGLSPKQLQEYTYYQLCCDNEMLQRIDESDYIHTYRSQGAKVDVPNVYKRMSCLDNPHSIDKLFKRVNPQQEVSEFRTGGN